MEYADIVRCPERNCKRTINDPHRGELTLSRAKFAKNVLVRGKFQCNTCGSAYYMQDGILNLLPEKISQFVQGKTKGDEPLQFEKEIVEGIKWNRKMVQSYHANVVDEFTSAFGARFLERYEDLFIDRILNEHVKKNDEGTIFLEMGVGTGRYLTRYGSRILNSQNKRPERAFGQMIHKSLARRGSKVCEDYRKDSVLEKYYSHDDDYEKNLKLLIGVDFEEGMIKKCVGVLRDMKLTPLLGKRILLFIAAGQYFDLAFERSGEYKDCFKIVTCLFQTLGNQRREQQIELLKSMKNLAAPHGKVVVSVFNKEKFVEFGLKKLYHDVWPTVGNFSNETEAIKLRDKGVLVTEKGVYSQWFDKGELLELLDTAGLHATLVSSADHIVIHKDDKYIDETTQKEIGQVLIVAEANVSQ